MFIKLFALAASLLSLSLSVHAETYGPYAVETYIACKPGKPAASKVAVVVAHSDWVNGINREASSLLLCHAFSAKGIYAVSIGYRRVGGAHWPAPLQDVQTAIRWLRSEGYRTVGVAGMSAGGNLSLMAGAVETTMVSPSTDPRGEAALYPRLRSQADFVIDISGPPDIAAKDAAGPSDAILKGIVMSKQIAEAAVSPITYISGTMPPTLIFQGQTDPLVTFQMVGELTRVLKNKGAVFQVQHYRGGNTFKGLPATAITACMKEAAQFALTRTPGLNDQDCEGPVLK